MRYAEEKHASNKSRSPLFILCFLVVFVCAASLGSLRLYGIYLEHMVAETSGKIEECHAQQKVMMRQYSELLSPERVCDYAKDSLNMGGDAQVKTIYIDAGAVSTAKAAANPVAASNAGILESFNPFVNKAHAKN